MAKNKFNIIVPLIIMITSCVSTQAQQTVDAAGGHSSGSGGSIGYSVGQLTTSTHSSASGKIAQGVHHGFEVINSSVNGSKYDQLLSVFPNPTENDLTLSIKDFRNEKLSFQICDVQGKILSTQPIKAQQSKIGMSNLAPANYLLFILDKDGQKVQSFKILKN
jgi:hypothetical protein